MRIALAPVTDSLKKPTKSRDTFPNDLLGVSLITISAFVSFPFYTFGIFDNDLYALLNSRAFPSVYIVAEFNEKFLANHNVFPVGHREIYVVHYFYLFC